jgi:RNA methyltransferase, TrmH family
MLSKSRISLIRSLMHKKFRISHGLFVAEGEKTVKDLISASLDKNAFSIDSIYATSGWSDKNKNVRTAGLNITEVTDEELKRISSLTTPNKVLAVVRIPHFEYDKKLIMNDLTLVLDDIQDPGNLGTIIRIAHWYGIKQIFCSQNSTDLYNPKTIQSAMGSLWSVRVFYTELASFIKYYFESTDLPVIGTFLKGQSIYIRQPEPRGLIVLGNEARGISEKLEPYIRTRITIPAYYENSRPDSINVAMSAAIICSELRRNQMINRNE